MLLLTLPIQAVFALGRRPRFTVGDSIEWNPECKKMVWNPIINAEFVKFQLRRLKAMYTAGSHPLTSPVAVFPGEVDAHGKTENRVVWNEQECAAEEQELVYEVTWIPELGAWRRFLRSRRKVRR